MDSLLTHNIPAFDDQLLARISKGDRQALGQLFDLSNQLLFTLAMRILAHREDAMDTLQDVYLEVWRKAARYDIRRGTPMAWMIALTRNRAVDRLRSRGQRSGPRATAADRAAGQHEDRDSSTRDGDPAFRQAVSQALDSLPADHRQVLELAYFEGLSYSEMASRLNEPTGTMKTRIKVGMEQLRATLRTEKEPQKRYGT